MKSIALTCALLAASLQAYAAEKLIGGPFVVHDAPTSATVTWIVEGGEAGKSDKKAPAMRAARASYSGLQPGTTYYYDALGRDESRGSFKTAPSGPADFQFVVYGDTRTRHDMHRRVIAAVIKHGIPDFVMHTGDLVANGADSTQWPVFFEIERELLRHTAFFPSLGNHERNDPQYYEFFDVTTPYYSFDWGQAHFIVLNSDIGNAAASHSAKESFCEKWSPIMGDNLARNRSKADLDWDITVKSIKKRFNHYIANLSAFLRLHPGETP